MSAQIAASPAPSPSSPRKALMKVGTQQGDSEDMLRAFAAFGVNNICGSLPSTTLDDAWSVDALSMRRERVEAHGISLDMLPLPMSSHEIGTAELPAIYLGASAERYRGAWTYRAGFFDLSDVPNSAHLEPGFHEYQLLGEIERRYGLRDQSGKVLATYYQSHGRMGLLDDAVRLAEETGAAADVAAVRKFRTRGGLSVAQICVGVLLHTPGLTGVIAGARNARQGAMVPSLGVGVSDEQAREVWAIADELARDLERL